MRVLKDGKVLLWGMDVGTVDLVAPSAQRASSLRWKSGVLVEGLGFVGGGGRLVGMEDVLVRVEGEENAGICEEEEEEEGVDFGDGVGPDLGMDQVLVRESAGTGVGEEEGEGFGF